MASNTVVNIVIPQGSDFTETFVSTESDGTATNLDSYSGVALLKKHPTATSSSSFSVTVSGSNGEVAIAMTSGITANLNPGRYYYDVRVTSPAGAVSRLVEGMALVTAGITT